VKLRVTGGTRLHRGGTRTSCKRRRKKRRSRKNKSCVGWVEARPTRTWIRARERFARERKIEGSESSSSMGGRGCTRGDLSTRRTARCSGSIAGLRPAVFTGAAIYTVGIPPKFVRHSGDYDTNGRRGKRDGAPPPPSTRRSAARACRASSTSRRFNIFRQHRTERRGRDLQARHERQTASFPTKTRRRAKSGMRTRFSRSRTGFRAGSGRPIVIVQPGGSRARRHSEGRQT